MIEVVLLDSSAFSLLWSFDLCSGGSSVGGCWAPDGGLCSGDFAIAARFKLGVFYRILLSNGGAVNA